MKKSEINNFFVNTEAEEQALTVDSDFGDFIDSGELELLIPEFSILFQGRNGRVNSDNQSIIFLQKAGFF
jgi:hypothetical protein